MVQKLKSNDLLGKRIRTLRLNSDFHVAELAREMQLRGCDITRETLVKIESGKRHITVNELIALKEALNISYEQIFDNLLNEEEV
ncbi:MAG: helix-turn-helix domain-containing protein [Eubacterium sp.]|nr:helix-turn-helix domain-containing protein [Eubacterium sp.]MCM1302909.1 helix-turn-helix domain-containing protein [Butyrivibrio sp.]MCM1342981.1 helix-turn-helix domain-containing protein [Muribaculaceae bacterium]MCM1410711.1 helix-turn-helix domain-containing protein [Lachnospiraceae bacterium]